MLFLSNVFDFVLHIDKYLSLIIADYGVLAYGIIFLIIFCETGLVVTPFLPGDSLIFALGALSATGSLNPFIVFIVLVFAALLGDTLNFTIGRFLGNKLMEKEKTWFFKKDHLLETQAFYKKYGAMTIILARYVPIVRTFSPFVAGMGNMRYSKFIANSALGAVLWVGLFTTVGYLFGNLPFVKKNFSLIVIAIIFVSVLPAVFAIIKSKLAKKSAKTKEK